MTSEPSITSNDYDELRQSLNDSGALIALSELHGGVSGALCAGGPPAAARWVDEFCADHDAASSPGVQDTALGLVILSIGETNEPAKRSSDRSCPGQSRIATQGAR